MNIAGLMNKPKYSKNIYRVGDTKMSAPYTLLRTDVGSTTVVLPLPVNLQSNMGADWQQEGVGKLAYLARQNKEAIEDLKEIRNYKDIQNILDNGLAKIIRGGNADVKAIYARSVNTSSKLGGTRISSNPRNEMLFNGMPFKTYSFNFNLVPYRKQDSEDIMETIRAIQKASAPAMRGEKMFMEYPNTWFIEFYAGDGLNGNKYIMKLNECACTSVNINYTPNNDTSNMHEDNAPMAVELGLEFSEIIIPTKETIEEGFNG